MASCLGIYLSNNVIKYAKLTSDNNNNVKVESYGVRFVKENQNETLKNIIDETNSQNIPIVMNPQGDRFINYQMFDQVQNSGISSDVARMEFEAWCEKNAKSPDKYSYVFKNADEKNEENKFNSVIDFIEKKNISDYQQIGDQTVVGIYPPQLLLYKLVSKEEKNYMLIDLDSELSLNVVIDGKLKDIKFYDVGMKQILDEFAVKLGSYQKAYEACKQLNVYSDDASTNDKLLESIAEPVLQEVLRTIAAMVTRYRNKLEKVILTGSGIVFTNIDILIREYISIKCEILKPSCVNSTGIRNIVEALEATPAIAIASSMLLGTDSSLNFVNNSKTKIKKEFNNIFSGLKKSKNKKVTIGNNISQSNNPNDSVVENKSAEIGAEIVGNKSDFVTMCLAIISSVVLISYIIFTILYTNNVNNNIKKIEEAQTNVKQSTALVNEDMKYITASTDKYSQINSQVADVVDKIENNKIGKFSTYNVASFLQNIISIIPRNVQLRTISSDDNKNIVITAQSDSYADLGYFVAALKINSTLNNIVINRVTNGEITVVEIGGELP